MKFFEKTLNLSLIICSSLIFLIACSKEGSFTLETFDYVIRQSSLSSKVMLSKVMHSMPNTNIVTI